MNTTELQRHDSQKPGPVRAIATGMLLAIGAIAGVVAMLAGIAALMR